MLVPLAEGGYHLLKPWPETLAMVAFSVVMTQYALRRKNLVIPFLAHLAVELFLILGMMIW
jgi:membrane protease YdiL (CAAX protease family)